MQNQYWLTFGGNRISKINSIGHGPEEEICHIYSLLIIEHNKALPRCLGQFISEFLYANYQLSMNKTCYELPILVAVSEKADVHGESGALTESSGRSPVHVWKTRATTTTTSGQAGERARCLQVNGGKRNAINDSTAFGNYTDLTKLEILIWVLCQHFVDLSIMHIWTLQEILLHVMK